MGTALVELRILEGPNLYFPRAAVKLTLDLTGLVEAPDDLAQRLAERIGLPSARPGPAGSGFRQRFAARAVGRLVRQVAGEAGTSRLAVRVRPTSDVHRVVVAYPWRNRTRAETLGRAVGDVLDGLGAADLTELVGTAAARVRAAERGPGPSTLRPRVPVVAVTGTNGKTTTSRMIAHIARTKGLHVCAEPAGQRVVNLDDLGPERGRGGDYRDAGALPPGEEDEPLQHGVAAELVLGAADRHQWSSPRCWGGDPERLSRVMWPVRHAAQPTGWKSWLP
jgi:Mur ligase middle domain